MDVANEILDAIEIVADKKIREQTTQIYPGICKSVNGNSCVMSINGKDNTVQFYGSAPIVGTIYRVFVPYGNMSMAFIITANDNGSSASGVSSVNGLTGDVNLTASDVGAAPAGYGLGTTPKKITDWNDAKLDGWYYSSEGAVNAPDPTIWCFGRVDNHGNPEVCIQEVWGLANINKYYHWIRLIYPTGGTPWEWVDPPFVVDTVYRTTERHLDKPVYKKMDSNGVIWWSTDQSTWKCESERVGAYSKIETDSLLQKKANQNLLDNWYFGNPVNQRGQTTYTTHSSGDQYTIDRWLFGANNTITLQDGYISVGIPYSMVQYIEPDLCKSLAGRTLTFSLLYKDGTLLERAFKFNSDYTNVWIEENFDNNRGALIFESRKGRLKLVFYNSQYGDIVAVKLEFGDHQTLAHQENGNWVLNEIPNYGEQLTRCQRYFVNFNPNKVNWFAMPPAIASNTTDAYSAVTLPVAMRAQPTVSYGGKIALSQTGDVQITGIQVSRNTFAGNYIQLRYSVANGLTANSTYRVQGYNDPTSYIWLSADL